MKSCSSAVCVLVLLITTGSESSFTSVRVKLHDSATLPCAGTCSGVVRWTALHKPTDVLAECDQTSCRSVKEGYQMNHDQYLKGNFSLIITKAEFNTKTWFTSKCDDDVLCEVDVETYHDPTDSGAVLPVWVTVLVGMVSLFVIMGLVVVILRQRKKITRFR